ncbi:MAG: CHRD domain-containing protein, partial [Bacteroidetes bacterium]|nr:CHRD domain-containing protein [Bacteroidota bacterium]
MKQHIVRLFILTVIIAMTVSAKAPGEKMQRSSNSAGVPSSTLLNINNISAWYTNNGESERTPFTLTSGLTFPRGTSTAVYSAGLMFGAVATDGQSSGPRIVGHSYNSGFAPGAILGTRTGIVESAADPNVRIWRVRKDYATADLLQDAAEYFAKPAASVTADDIQALRDQYKKDWQEWPASKGAPFYDANNDGIYSPQFETVDGKEVPKLFPTADEAGIAKADQVIWYVCNDIANGDSPWKTKPMGLEQQVTIWGYKSTGVNGNILYKKHKLIYKGTSLTPVGSQLQNAYLTHWSDPDLGDAGDDYVGCDTVLSLGYIYNSKTIDAEYSKFNLIPPALGYDFLQGPMVPSANDTAVFDLKKRPGFKNLPMTSFIYFAAGDMYSDPPPTLNGSVQWYQMMRGLPPTPQGPPDPAPFKDPQTLQPSHHWFPGDPVTNTGWTDGIISNPGDRRMLQTSGPFTMALGDTQEIVVGVVAGIGTDYLHSISVMKENDRNVQLMYNSLFTVIPPNITAEVTYPSAGQANVKINASAVKGAFTSIYGTVNGTTIQLFDDGSHNDKDPNDGIFSNENTLARSGTPYGVDLTFTDLSGKTYTITKAMDLLTTSGPIDVTAKVIFDNINNDGVVNNGEFVNYVLTVKNNTISEVRSLKAVVSSATKFVSEYNFGDIAISGEVTMNTAQSFSLRIPMSYSQSTLPMTAVFADAKGNRWNAEWSFPVVQFASVRDSIPNIAENTVGKNDGEIGVIVFDPAAAGQTFDVWYGVNGANVDWTVVKNLPGTDYASVAAALSPKKLVPAINTLPNAVGTGTFTVNDAHTQMQYSVTVSGLTGAVSSAAIYLGSYSSNGVPVKTLTFTGNSAAGSWSKSDLSEPFADSLFKHLIAGNLYVNVTTAANPNGEVRGQIADGMIVRQIIDPTKVPIQPIFANAENRFTGFSLYVGRPKTGSKGVQQTEPTVGNVFNTVNPENTYRLFDSLKSNFLGQKPTEATVELKFNSEVNWALAALPVASPTPTQTYFIKVPFAVYKDTVRVIPFVVDKNNDSVWNTTQNRLYAGKPLFDNIKGIADTRDGGNNDLRYYSPTNTVFPPTSNVVKGRYLNGVNHILSNIL